MEKKEVTILAFNPNNPSYADLASKIEQYYQAYGETNLGWDNVYFPEVNFAVAAAYSPEQQKIYGAACLSGNDPEQFLVYTTSDGTSVPIYQLDNNVVDPDHRNQGIGSLLVVERMNIVAQHITESGQPAFVRIGFDPDHAGWGQKIINLIENTPTITSNPNNPDLQEYLGEKSSMVQFYVDEDEETGKKTVVIIQQCRPDPNNNEIIISSISTPLEQHPKVITALANYQPGSPESSPDSLSKKEGVLKWTNGSMPTLENIATDLGIDPAQINVQKEHVFCFAPTKS